MQRDLKKNILNKAEDASMNVLYNIISWIVKSFNSSQKGLSCTHLGRLVKNKNLLLVLLNNSDSEGYETKSDSKANTNIYI